MSARMLRNDEPRPFTVEGVWIDHKPRSVTMLLAGKPVVIIDPEDMERLERLWTILRDGLALQSRGNLQAALREFAQPTVVKPEEPLGLGAVVEDADGKRWTRWTTQAIDRPWTTVDGLESHAVSIDRNYAEVTAVKKLSEGVTP